MRIKASTKNKICLIGRVLYSIFMVLIIGVMITTLVAKHDSTKKGEPIMVFGYSPTITVSGSMLPNIQVYSMSFIDHCDIEEVKDGDVITYKHPHTGRIVIHRVISTYTNSKNEYCLQTKGDNNRSPDNIEITSYEFRGKVIKTFNSVAPILKGVMNEDGISINYAKLYGYTFILIVLIWAILSSLTWVIKKVLKGVIIVVDDSTPVEELEAIAEEIKSSGVLDDVLEDSK